MISVNPNSKKSNTQQERYDIPESALRRYTPLNQNPEDDNNIVILINTYGGLYPIINKVLAGIQDKAPGLLDCCYVKFTDKGEDNLKLVIYDTNGWEEKFLIGLKDLGTSSQLQIVDTYCDKAIASYREHLNSTEEAEELSFNDSIDYFKEIFGSLIEELIEKEVNRRVKERLDKLITLIEEIR